MKKWLWIVLFPLALLTSCGSGNREKAIDKIEYEYHAFEMDMVVMTAEMPAEWEYSYSPEYGGMYFKEMFTRLLRDGEEWEEKSMLYFHYGAVGNYLAVSSGKPEQQAEQESGEWEAYRFADGAEGQRRVSDRDGRRREQIYHPGVDRLISLDTSAQDYSEHGEEVRHFLDSIAFEQGGISARTQGSVPEGGTAAGSAQDAKDSAANNLPDSTKSVSQAGSPGREYYFHLYRWDLRADLTVREGFSFDWQGYALDEWPNEYYEWGGCMTLYLDEERENVLILGAEYRPKGDEAGSSIPAGAGQEGEARYVALASGMRGWRYDFTLNGKKGSYVNVSRPECGIQIYGDRTEELEAMLQSLRVW